MSQSTELHVPDGYYPPYAVVTDTDHGAWIIIAVALGFTFVIISSLIRIFLRISFVQRPGLDDTFLFVATLLALIQTCIILQACSRGLGRSIELLSQDAVDSIQKSYYASNIFVTVSLALSRCSVLIFILRLTPIESHRHIAYGIIIATTLWAFGAVFAGALQCDPSQPWKLVGQQCPHVYTRLKAVCIIDAILEAALVACTCWLIRPLKTSASNKFMVVFVFSFRLPLIIIIGFRLHSFNYNNLTTNFTFYESLYVTLTQTQVNYSLISATIPNLRPIINNLNTHYGAMAESTITGSNYNSNSGSRTTGARSVNNRKSRRRSSLANMFPMRPLRKLSLKPKDSAHSGKKGSGNGSGSGSGSGSRGAWDDMPDLVHVPSIGTQAVDTGSSVRIHAGNSSLGMAREAEEGRASSTTRDAEVMSTMSSESRRMMIRKEVDIHVESGGR